MLDLQKMLRDAVAELDREEQRDRQQERRREVSGPLGGRVDERLRVDVVRWRHGRRGRRERAGDRPLAVRLRVRDRGGRLDLSGKA